MVELIYNEKGQAIGCSIIQNTENRDDTEDVTVRSEPKKLPHAGKNPAVPSAAAAKRSPIRIYVKVCSDFDRTGYMQPRTITWEDGRIFTIEAVRDYRPRLSEAGSVLGDCYTVIIRGEEKHLFFERTSEHSSGRVGRWFVENSR